MRDIAYLIFFLSSGGLSAAKHPEEPVIRTLTETDSPTVLEESQPTLYKDPIKSTNSKSKLSSDTFHFFLSIPILPQA